MTKIKICGLSRGEDIAAANALAPDYIGFVFAKSKRQVSPEQARALKALLDPSITAVGVFVDAPFADILALVSEGIINAVQLHGAETEAQLHALHAACALHCASAQCKPIPIIKAIRVQSAADVLAWRDSCADYLLLDNGAGGTGKPFDWGVLAQLGGETVFQKIIIAGGLTPQNVAQVLPFAPYAVDVSGGVETDGYKDAAKMNAFTQAVRKELV